MDSLSRVSWVFTLPFASSSRLSIRWTLSLVFCSSWRSWGHLWQIILRSQFVLLFTGTWNPPRGGLTSFTLLLLHGLRRIAIFVWCVITHPHYILVLVLWSSWRSCGQCWQIIFFCCFPLWEPDILHEAVWLVFYCLFKVRLFAIWVRRYHATSLGLTYRRLGFEWHVIMPLDNFS